MPPLLPADTTVMPLARGALLVSPSHAVFCGIPRETEPQIRRAMKGEAVALPGGVERSLRDHGFGGPPRAVKPPSPSVQLQLTNACNLACAYCCTNSGNPRQHEIGRDTAFAVVDDVARVLGEGTRVSLLGGEPLLVSWAVDLAEYVMDKNLTLAIFTNGIPLRDPSIARRVGALAGRGAQVRVSLAGATAETCDRVSGAPRFQLVLEGIRTLADHGPPPSVDLMLLPGQIDDVVEHLPRLREQLPDATPIALGVPYLSGRERGEHLFGSRAQLEEALDRIAFEAGETIAAPETKPVADRRLGCSCALGEHLHVRSDGTLFTCFKMEERVGDLRAMTFEQGLRSLRDNARPVTTLPLCRDCPLATLCGGGCRSENLQYTGDADTPVCGPWRVQVLAELLAEDRVTALEWPAEHLLAEAHARGIEAPESLRPVVPSRHLVDVS